MRWKRLIYIFWSLFTVWLLVGCGASGPDDTVLTAAFTETKVALAPVLVAADTYEGVIFPPEVSARVAPGKADAGWMPTEADIAALEDGLITFLQESGDVAPLESDDPPLWQRVPAYKRQYFGIEQAGKRLIYVEFFCKTSGLDWRSVPLEVSDGGDCYFQTTYDVDTDSFLSISINGEA